MSFRIIVHCLMLFCAATLAVKSTSAQAAPVQIYGKTLAQIPAFQKMLKSVHVTSHNLTSLQELDSTESPLLILASEKALPTSSLLQISNYLQKGGNVIVIGTQNFYGAPQPVREIPIGDLSQQNSFKIIKPDNGKGNGENPRIQTITDHKNKAALRLTTFKRDMINLRIQFPVKTTRSAKRTVLTFSAKGDAYMDLLFLEAVDSAGQKYFSLVPLAPQWQNYTVSLADFIPADWKDPLKPYPLIDPAKIETIAMGTNRNILWQEKPMDWCLGQVNLAEEKNDLYAPTAANSKLSVPFKEIGIAAPQWLFAPFYGNQAISAQSIVATANPKSTFKATAVICPPAYADFPGTKMGTDNKKEYDTRQEHSLRQKVLLATSDSNQPVAEMRLFTGGIYAGSDVALFGLSPQQIVSEPRLLEVLAQTVEEILYRPRLAQIKINTTTQQSHETIYPVLNITIKNPLNHAVKAEVMVNAGTDKLQQKSQITLPPRALSMQKIQLNEVPADFNFTQFQWNVTLKSEAGVDFWQDTVDVERLLLQAIIHMASAQKKYPDGRISNHYFADAYGVRAMYAYLRFLKKHPDHLKKNSDLWQQITPQQIRESARRFGDMLVRRQNSNGSVPMGYGEQTNSFNVADGGQISLGLGTMAFEESDAMRRDQYLKACQNIIDFAETFYIDKQRLQQLKNDEADNVKKYNTQVGYYGLGVYSGGRRISAGPVWVLSDILAPQALLATVYPESNYGAILKRNIDVYLQHARPAAGWYQAEAMIWCYVTVRDAATRQRIADNLKSTFLPTLYQGKEDDIYDAGARGTLRGLPLLYCRQLLGDSPNARAALLKYVWTAGSETSSESVAKLAREYPNPHHGMSLEAMKFAEFSSIWAMELLEPRSTLLQMNDFER